MCLFWKIRGTQYRLFPLPLHTVRPFILDELDLTQPHEGDPGTAIKKNVELSVSSCC